MIVCTIQRRGEHDARAVNILAAAVRRNLPGLQRFICYTDDPDGLAPGIEIKRIPASGKPDVFPSLWLSPDMVVLDDISILFDGKDHPGVIVPYETAAKMGPPLGCKIVDFDGPTKPWHVTEGWVPMAWREQGQLKWEPGCNVSADAILGNVRANCRREVRWFTGGPPRRGSEHAVLVGGGPSLAGELDHIRYRARRGDAIFAMNGTHDWLIERKIIPQFMVVLDARESNARFVARPHPDVRYLIASMCHPAVLDALKAHPRVVLWHADDGGVRQIVESCDAGRPWALVGGGNTVGLKAMCLAFLIGFRRLHLYGYDSSFRDDAHHAYTQPENEGDAALEVSGYGRTFRAARWMITQAENFRDMLPEFMGNGCQVQVHGEGLLPWIAKQTLRKEAA